MAAAFAIRSSAFPRSVFGFMYANWNVSLTYLRVLLAFNFGPEFSAFSGTGCKYSASHVDAKRDPDLRTFAPRTVR